ncbi:MAG: coiled-coil protein [Candidatus Bathyarchaeia archaeon]
MERGDSKLVDDAVESKIERVAAINKELETLKAQRDKLLSEYKLWAENRDSLNKELKELRGRVRDLKGKRDSVNAEVKDLKGARDQTRLEMNEKRRRLKEIVSDLKKIRPQIQGTFTQTKSSLEKLEWKLQTSSMDLAEEKKLINHIKELEIQLSNHEKLKELQEAFTEQRVAIEALNLKAQSIHEKILELAQKSAQLHEEMMQTVRKIDEVKAKADEAHRTCLKVRTEAERLEEEIMKRVTERRELQKSIHEQRAAEQLKRQQEIIDKLVESGSAKLSEGKRLSFEEFKALMEKKKL